MRSTAGARVSGTLEESSDQSGSGSAGAPVDRRSDD
jgi:hypothetical protein